MGGEVESSERDASSSTRGGRSGRSLSAEIAVCDCCPFVARSGGAGRGRGRTRISRRGPNGARAGRRLDGPLLPPTFMPTNDHLALCWLRPSRRQATQTTRNEPHRCRPLRTRSNDRWLLARPHRRPPPGPPSSTPVCFLVVRRVSAEEIILR